MLSARLKTRHKQWCRACKQNVNFPPILDLHHSQGVLQRNTSARVGTPPRFKPSGRTRWRRHISGDSREQQRFARGAAGALPGNLFAVLPPASWRAEGGIERRPIAGGRQQASWSFGGRLLRYRPVLPHSHSIINGAVSALICLLFFHIEFRNTLLYTLPKKFLLLPVVARSNWRNSFILHRRGVIKLRYDALG